MKKPLPLDPSPETFSEKEKWIPAALAAWGRGDMTPAQQRNILAWIITDLCGGLAIDMPGMSEREAGYTAGQRRVGMVLMKLTKSKLVLASPNEDNNERSRDDN